MPREGFEKRDADSPKWRKVTKSQWQGSAFVCRKPDKPAPYKPLNCQELYTKPENKISPAKEVAATRDVLTPKQKELLALDAKNTETGIAYGKKSLKDLEQTVKPQEPTFVTPSKPDAVWA